ncbi:hypothetical protein Mgra_00004319 [Meloidogyne graminicola]|uniref:Uncharacterized protein n=1 Tax=Meloidogyne graminicola TaxID=189291 RepID=A0A8S9ZSB1_9BILA|nr:hypothetical protein Mgra_00004319 [Meloidogyne graminicola]
MNLLYLLKILLIVWLNLIASDCEDLSICNNLNKNQINQKLSKRFQLEFKNWIGTFVCNECKNCEHLNYVKIEEKDEIIEKIRNGGFLNDHMSYVEEIDEEIENDGNCQKVIYSENIYTEETGLTTMSETGKTNEIITTPSTLLITKSPGENTIFSIKTKSFGKSNGKESYFGLIFCSNSKNVNGECEKNKTILSLEYNFKTNKFISKKGIFEMKKPIEIKNIKTEELEIEFILKKDQIEITDYGEIKDIKIESFDIPYYKTDLKLKHNSVFPTYFSIALLKENDKFKLDYANDKENLTKYAKEKKKVPLIIFVTIVDLIEKESKKTIPSIFMRYLELINTTKYGPKFTGPLNMTILEKRPEKLEMKISFNYIKKQPSFNAATIISNSTGKLLTYLI